MSILLGVLRDLVGRGPDQRSVEESLRVFIGYDERQPVAFNVLQQSLLSRSSRPLSITPLVLETLPIERRGLTPFTFTRFLVPWLCRYEGWALFLDLDMLALGDIGEVFDAADESYAILVTKSSQRFEWASGMLFNCAHRANRILDPDYVDDSQRCRAPHLLDWLSEPLIGALPSEWNHTVGYDPPRPDAKLVHYTQGIPKHPEVGGCEYADEWFAEFDRIGFTQGWNELMGQSVHANVLPDGRAVPKLQPGAPEDASVAGVADLAPAGGFSRDNPSPRYRELLDLYRHMHAEGDRLNRISSEQTFDGRSLYPHLQTIQDLSRKFGAKSLLDYGCGKGQAYRGEITLPDGSTVASLRELWGVDDIGLYDPGYSPYSDRPAGPFDGVVSTDMLEHCPEDDIEWIMADMFEYSREFLFCTISCRPAVKRLPTGENAHITIKSPDWWRERLRVVGEQYPGVRYLVVCYGHGDEPVFVEG